MRAVITKILPTYPKAVQIQWDLEAVTETGVFTFVVERSGSSLGPWVTVATLTDTYLYTDLFKTPATEIINAMSLQRDIYYRVKAIPPSGTLNAEYSACMNLDGQVQSITDGPQPVIGYRVTSPGQYELAPGSTGLEARPDAPATYDDRVRRRLLRRKILRDETILLKKLAGIEFLLLKRRHFGERCTACYDPVTKNVLKTACPVCYGTSWKNGYFTPVPLLGRRMSSRVQAGVTPQEKSDSNNTQIQFLDFPRIDEEDIIIERAHNKRFLVKERYFTSLKTVTVHQTAVVSELERQAIEYSIPVTL